jgi:tRNA dimethylallyltransferase
VQRPLAAVASIPPSDGAPLPGRPLALVGPTASGKTALALAVARQVDGTEIVSADAMAVYRGMDLGTAKPSPADRRDVRHHLLDIVDPGEEFTVQRFQVEAERALDEIASRGNPALLVGGTGLYVRAVIDRLDVPGRWPDVAHRFEEEASGEDGTRQLHSHLLAIDPVAASRMEPTNRRRVVRALEVTIGSGRPFSSYGPGLQRYGPTRFVLVGVPYDPATVEQRITARFSAMLDSGFLEEVRALAARPQGLSRTSRQALGYREMLDHIEHGRPLDDAVAEAIRRTRALARRQWAWFRRDPRIQWLAPGEGDDRVVELWAAAGPAPSGQVLDGTPSGQEADETPAGAGVNLRTSRPGTRRSTPHVGMGD